MTFSFPPKQLQFFLTAPAPCPYLPEQVETKLFTYLSKSDGQQINDALSHVGFRRAQNIAYRPACQDCDACKSCRIRVADFVLNKSFRRILNKNTDIIRDVSSPVSTPEHFALIARYLSARHQAGGMEGMDESDFTALVEETSVATELVNYRDGNAQLLASAIVDQLQDGPSLVYSFFSPKQTNRSLGLYMILDHIARAKETEKPYVYLGFWVQDSPKMNYKQRFQPLEILQNQNWEEFATKKE
ncbi:Arginyl-tRNA--protein transferase [hydrothermal vent metagenome]|uniref:Arginyl-tRNA--protein transferase n=1 Tax=hydrothermal vent metagenome TaxID=652676 RepID=A0A3B0R5S5_9ZZZZ